jgi:hypothetical protein
VLSGALRGKARDIEETSVLSWKRLGCCGQYRAIKRTTLVLSGAYNYRAIGRKVSCYQAQ